jgi:hypothetical protein
MLSVLGQINLQYNLSKQVKLLVMVTLPETLERPSF